MKELRERGLYRLPDGGEFVVGIAARGGGYELYDPQIFKRHGLPDYQIDAQGRLNQMGQSTRWSAEDLIDTGRTAV
ncbi:MAG TPA: hypothetical protein VN956_25100 [Pyrinomonadaceae bacterium]|nr:hypothetical protein [Pyrinomonadaceae bacterium]